MFGVGTKIRLVASSCRKQTGPKRGSLGYISSMTGRPHTSIKMNTVARIAKVVFFKYGFEKKDRLEQKDIVVVFPIVDRKKDNVRSKIDKVKNLVDGRNDSTLIEHVRNSITNKSNTPVAIAVPVTTDGLSLLKCSANEFKAWVSSYIMSNRFAPFVQNATMLGHYKQAKHAQLAQSSTWNTLRSMSMGRDHRMKYLKGWEQDRGCVVDTFRIILSMFARNESKNLCDENINNIILSTDSPSREGVYSRLSQILFNEPALNRIKRATAGARNYPALIDNLEDIEAVRGELLVLSDRMRRRYNQA